MRRIIVLIALIGIYNLSFAQCVKGVVLNKKTNEKICFATIYFNSTFTGTTSDEDGNFSLKVPKGVNMPLVVSSIGYYSVTVPKYNQEDTLVIRLTPKDYEIEEVSVRGKSLVRKKKAYLRIFRNQFLGETRNGVRCEITNEKDISFNYNSCSDTLKAFASKPIEIVNKALGYRIIYYLDRFEYYRQTQSFLYVGHIIFKEDLATKGDKSGEYLQARKDTYIGSRMHFFRALWKNDLERNGFSVRDEFGSKLRYEKYVHKYASKYLGSNDGIMKYMSYPKQLSVFHFAKVSTMEFTEPKVYFDERGYFDIGLFWEGEMSDKRVGDTLPFEFILAG
ncbi:carboxypeptidase-like regulatory domain-containing protein [Marinifilum fragile]|uniref:carboxypeptidase-like regulatory domain-containing protein n=1 Tax=Marinifilum fragile TaxID=570161 RepID=UPI002AA6D5BD|nr:carboxypeptidase-like regulatory domain-containing protein [Marinifilum fragile]